jgi:hypothetical protein
VHGVRPNAPAAQRSDRTTDAAARFVSDIGAATPSFVMKVWLRCARELHKKCVYRGPCKCTSAGVFEPKGASQTAPAALLGRRHLLSRVVSKPTSWPAQTASHVAPMAARFRVPDADSSFSKERRAEDTILSPWGPHRLANGPPAFQRSLS